ncbi:MAG: hypothetical protein ACOC1U_08360, partial [Spirochaetota bacterium]
MASRIALLALLLCLAVPLAAQTVPSPLEEEAPETLLDLELGQADVSFVGLGGWTTGIAPALGWIVGRDDSGALRVEPGYRFPGLEPVPFFNRVDLTISLWLLGRYFFETTVSEEIDQSTLLFGYNGLPGESVQSVIVGNAAIGIGSYPYLGFGDESGSVGQDATGASALFESPASTHELMVRFAPAAEQEIRYAGGGIVDESSLRAIDYRRGTDYVLPDGAIDLLELYERDPDGEFTDSDGNRYRRVDLQQETVFSLNDGTLSFAERPDRRVYVYYEAQGLPIGDASLGADSYFGLTAAGSPDPSDPRDFSFAAIDPAYLETVGGGGVPDGLSASDLVATIDGRQAFLLHDPERYSPFELAARYELGQAQVDSLLLATPAGSEIASSLAISYLPERSLVVLRAPTSSPRAFANRYPLASGLVAEPTPEIYGPRASSPADAPRVVARTVRPSETITLPPGFIPGSVRVTRNGRTEQRFTVTDSGELVFDDPVTDRDVIRVDYRTSDAADSADLLVASGNRFSIAPGTDATVALGARWKPVGERYSTRAGEYPGRVTLSASMETDSARWQLDPGGPDTAPPERAAPPAAGGSLNARAQGAAGISVADTSGALRIAGMGESQREIPVSPLGVYPAPPPVGDPDGSGGLTPAALALDRRGTLLYRDHFVTDFTGSRSLLRYDAPPELVTPYPYEAGGRSGPFPALSVDDAAPGTVAVFDYELAADRAWVAGLIRVDGGSGMDLSDARTIVVPYRVLDADGAVRLLVQAGAIGEDLDGDGRLDSGADGVAFDDPAAGFTLTAGAIPPVGRVSTEDANGNGVLDPELPELVATAEAASLSEGAWRTLVIDLDEEHAWKL